MDREATSESVRELEIYSGAISNNESIEGLLWATTKAPPFFVATRPIQERG
jgi:hypothetical protein